MTKKKSVKLGGELSALEASRMVRLLGKEAERARDLLAKPLLRKEAIGHLPFGELAVTNTFSSLNAANMVGNYMAARLHDAFINAVCDGQLSAIAACLRSGEFREAAKDVETLAALFLVVSQAVRARETMSNDRKVRDIKQAATSALKAVNNAIEPTVTKRRVGSKKGGESQRAKAADNHREWISEARKVVKKKPYFSTIEIARSVKRNLATSSSIETIRKVIAAALP